MPVSLTVAQEAQIKAANNKLASAKSALDDATSDAYDKLARLNRCNCGKGKDFGVCRPLIKKYTFPELANINDCKFPHDFAKCKTDCCSRATCIDKVNQYNESISVYNAAKDNFSIAEKNLKDTLDAISKDPTVAANTSIINNQIDAQKKKDAIKWLFFGLAVVIIIGGGLILGARMLRGSNA